MNNTQPTHSKQMPSVSHLIDTTFEIYKKIWKVCFGISCVTVIPELALIILNRFSPDAAPDMSTDAAFWVILCILLVITVFLYMWKYNALIVAMRDRDAGPKIETSLQESIRFILPSILIVALETLIFAGGFLLVIVPFVIFLAWYLFPSYILVYEGKRGWAAFKASREYVRGFWVQVTWRNIAGAIGIGFISNLPVWTLGTYSADAREIIQLLTSAFFMTPLLIIYHCLMYEWLKHEKDVSHTASHQ